MLCWAWADGLERGHTEKERETLGRRENRGARVDTDWNDHFIHHLSLVFAPFFIACLRHLLPVSWWNTVPLPGQETHFLFYCRLLSAVSWPRRDVFARISTNVDFSRVTRSQPVLCKASANAERAMRCKEMLALVLR